MSRSQLEDRSSDDTSKQRQSPWKEDTRPLLPVQPLEKTKAAGEEEESEKGSASKLDGPSQLEDQEGVSTV